MVSVQGLISLNKLFSPLPTANNSDLAGLCTQQLSTCWGCQTWVYIASVHAASSTVRSYVCLDMSRKQYFLVVFYSPFLLCSFCPSSTMIPSLGVCKGSVYLCLNILQFLTAWTLASCRSLCCPLSVKRIFSDEYWETHLRLDIMISLMSQFTTIVY